MTLKLKLIPAAAGELFRPSNGSSGEVFMSCWCDNCKHDDGSWSQCDLIFLSMTYDTTDPEYPREWVYDANGAPTCTKFEKREDAE